MPNKQLYTLYYIKNGMLHYSEDDVKKAADLREWLLKQISDKQEEVDRLRNLLLLIDSLLKQESFKPASTLGRPEIYNVDTNAARRPSSVPITDESTQIEKSYTSGNKKSQVNNEDQKIAIKKEKEQDLGSKDKYETKELKRLKDNFLLATVKVSTSSVEILPEKSLSFDINTPPFKTFFIKRILDGMVNQDKEQLRKKQIGDSEILTYQIDEADGIIKKIIINNYREKERLTDIFNTSAWVFTRMLEKSSGTSSISGSSSSTSGV
ncbi:MAG: hypothetical protein WCB31_10355 [Nitrososphaeraceae archaeon]